MSAVCLHLMYIVSYLFTYLFTFTATKSAMETDLSKYILAAEEKNVQVVSPEVLENVSIEGILSNIKTCTICSWGSDPKARFVVQEKSSKSCSAPSKSSSKEMFKKDMTKSIKLTVKGGGAVDPESELDKKTHVLKSR